MPSSFSNVRVDASGIQEVCKSSEMQEILGSIARVWAESANDRATPWISDHILYGEDVEIPPYGSAVDTLSHTCVGVAYTQTTLGGRAESERKFLASQNH